MDSVIYRPVKMEDLSAILDILQEDDNDDIYRLYSPASLESIYRITRDNPEGFVVAEIEGRVVGVVIAHVLGPNVCFVGMNTVTKQCRGTGIGRQMFNTIKSFVGARDLTLSCAEISHEAYVKKGIAHIGFKVGDYVGKLDTTKWAVGDDALEIVGLDDVESSSLVEFDSSIAHRGSTNIVDAYLTCEGVVTVVAMKHGEIVGYGAIDTTHLRANRIGPLYADTPDIARAIMVRLAVIGDGRENFIISPHSGNGFQSMLAEMGYRHRNCGLFLFNRELYPVPIEKVFGSTNYAAYFV